MSLPHFLHISFADRPFISALRSSDVKACAYLRSDGSTSLSEPVTQIVDKLPRDCVADVVGTDEFSAVFRELPRLPMSA